MPLSLPENGVRFLPRLPWSVRLPRLLSSVHFLSFRFRDLSLHFLPTIRPRLFRSIVNLTVARSVSRYRKVVPRLTLLRREDVAPVLRVRRGDATANLLLLTVSLRIAGGVSSNAVVVATAPPGQAVLCPV